jgi:hypothetical protein
MEPHSSHRRSGLMVQASKWLAARDERNKYVSQIADRYTYWVSLVAMVLTTTHELRMSGHSEPLLVTLTLAGISGLLLLVRRWQLRRNAPTDERTTQLALRSFGWAESILMVGVIAYCCYGFYVRLTGRGDASQNYLVFLLPITLSLATMWATYLRNNIDEYQITYWLTILQFACVMPVQLLKDFTRGGLFSLILNPSWIFLAFVSYMSISVIRHERLKQKGPADE